MGGLPALVGPTTTVRHQGRTSRPWHPYDCSSPGNPGRTENKGGFRAINSHDVLWPFPAASYGRKSTGGTPVPPETGDTPLPPGRSEPEPVSIVLRMEDRSQLRPVRNRTERLLNVLKLFTKSSVGIRNQFPPLPPGVTS